MNDEEIALVFVESLWRKSLSYGKQEGWDLWRPESKWGNVCRPVPSDNRGKAPARPADLRLHTRYSAWALVGQTRPVRGGIQSQLSLNLVSKQKGKACDGFWTLSPAGDGGTQLPTQPHASGGDLFLIRGQDGRSCRDCQGFTGPWTITHCCPSM